MAYDPHRTTVLPQTVDHFPITDEMPAVNVGGRKPGRLLAGLLLGLLVAAGAVLVTAIVLDNRSNSVATGDDDIPETGEAPTVVGEAPTPVPPTEAEPGFWQVVGVPDGLNVRSGPGTENDVVGALPLGTRHVFSTGERTVANGLTWQRITFGDNDTTGWVAAQFLASDTAPDPNATASSVPTAAPSANVSVVCFQAGDDAGHIARIMFTNRTELSGFVETNGAQGATRSSVEGQLSNGTGTVTLMNQGTNVTVQERWVFNPANVVVGDGTALSVVSCASIGLN